MQLSLAAQEEKERMAHNPIDQEWILFGYTNENIGGLCEILEVIGSGQGEFKQHLPNDRVVSAYCNNSEIHGFSRKDKTKQEFGGGRIIIKKI